MLIILNIWCLKGHWRMKISFGSARSLLISDEKTGGIMDLFLAFKKLATDMDWQDDNVIFTDRSGETIRFIETIADSDRDSYTIKGRKTGLIIF